MKKRSGDEQYDGIEDIDAGHPPKDLENDNIISRQYLFQAQQSVKDNLKKHLCPGCGHQKLNQRQYLMGYKCTDCESKEFEG